VKHRQLKVSESSAPLINI